MSFVFDLSRAWPTVTSAVLDKLGTPEDPLVGVIAYTGCDDESKNVGAARVDDWLSAGYGVALVIENASRQFGTGAGAELAAHVLAGARGVGYDVDHCVLFASADYDALTASDYAAILKDWNAFAAAVPVPGYYGDSDSMVHLAVNAPKPPAVYWQSESASYSPEWPSHLANIWQRFNDPRGGGLPVDVNTILRYPLHFMGETVLSPADIQAVAAAVAGVELTDDMDTKTPKLTQPLGLWITRTNHRVNNDVEDLIRATGAGLVAKLAAVDAHLTATGGSISAVLQTVEAAIGKIQAGQLDPAAFVAALEAAGVPLELATDLAAHLKLTAA